MKKVFLDDLPRKEGWGDNGGKMVIDWIGSINSPVRFSYDEIEGIITIKEYNKVNGMLMVEYNKNLFKIAKSNLMDCNIGKVLGKRGRNYIYNIGESFSSNKGSISIVDKEYRYKDRVHKKNGKTYKLERRWYKYRCLICGYIGWIEEAHLKSGKGCSCCASKCVEKGINDIYTTAQFMVKLGVSVEDSYKYTCQASKKISVACPFCKNIKIIKISDIYKNKSIGCSCGSNISYPERLLYFVMKDLNINFLAQLTKTTFKWCDKFRYDFYIPELNCIIETNGMQHYEEHNWKRRGKSLEEEQENDRRKELLAKENGVKNYVVLDCRESDLEWIKNSIKNSKLTDLIDLSKVDWDKCEELALNNIVKEVCDYWNDKEEWETTSDLAKKFNIHSKTVSTYLKKGAAIGFCKYDAKEEMSKSAKNAIKKRTKKVRVFRGNDLVGVFESGTAVARESESLFGIKLIQSAISCCCNGLQKSHKGFTFKYVE